MPRNCFSSCSILCNLLRLSVTSQLSSYLSLFFSFLSSSFLFSRFATDNSTLLSSTIGGSLVDVSLPIFKLYQRPGARSSEKLEFECIISAKVGKHPIHLLSSLSISHRVGRQCRMFHEISETLVTTVYFRSPPANLERVSTDR